jgi:hypothetical protein
LRRARRILRRCHLALWWLILVALLVGFVRSIWAFDSLRFNYSGDAVLWSVRVSSEAGKLRFTCRYRPRVPSEYPGWNSTNHTGFATSSDRIRGNPNDWMMPPRWRSERSIPPWTHIRFFELILPYIYLLPVAAIGPFISLYRIPRRRRAKRLSRGHCPNCDYDLRRNPGRCSECGALVPTFPPAAESERPANLFAPPS